MTEPRWTVEFMPSWWNIDRKWPTDEPPTISDAAAAVLQGHKMYGPRFRRYLVDRAIRDHRDDRPVIAELSALYVWMQKCGGPGLFVLVPVPSEQPHAVRAQQTGGTK
jgi:hypothetical protein